MVRSRRFDRPYFSARLLTALEALLQNTLTVVEAPTGYGKTVAVKEFLSQAPVNLVVTTAKEITPESFWPDFCRNLVQGVPKDSGWLGANVTIDGEYLREKK